MANQAITLSGDKIVKKKILKRNCTISAARSILMIVLSKLKPVVVFESIKINITEVDVGCISVPFIIVNILFPRWVSEVF